MKSWMRKFAPALKIVFTVVVLAAVGRYFYRDLQQAGAKGLWKHALQPGWLILSGVLYILGLGCSAAFWIRLMKSLGQRPETLPAVRAYYLGHLGKYLPGKAWALVVRAGLARGAGVKMGVAGVTSLYEVLTTMAAGAMLAAVLFAIGAPDAATPEDWSALRRLFTEPDPDTGILDRKVLVLVALAMLVVVGFPIIPPVFNRLVKRLRSLKNLMAGQPTSEGIESTRLHVRLVVLLEGLVMTALGWLFLGASFWAVLQAVLENPRLPTISEWGQLSAILSLAYVVGFVVIIMPSGLGVREFFLRLFLVPELCRHWTGEDKAVVTAVLTVLLLRLVWTAAELVTAVIVYQFPRQQE
jgi:glycosyltransferase 2 family protein